MKKMAFFKSTILILCASVFLLSFTLLESYQEEKESKIYSLPQDYLKWAEASNQKNIGSYDELLVYWQSVNYDHEAWETGIKEVPRAYIISISDQWGTKTSKQISTNSKKRVFFRAIAPMVLYANELILKDRERLLEIKKQVLFHKELNETEQKFIADLAKLYKVKIGKQMDKDVLTKLDARVDIIPVSLALAQSAVESGWGTSRFTHVGNSIFGQWSWSDDAITPKEQREHLGNYGIASFSSLQESVCAYMLNINSHYAYEELRKIRADLRAQNQTPRGVVLASGLLRYSERGESYVKEIRSMISYNHLEATDEAFLRDEEPVFLVRK